MKLMITCNLLGPEIGTSVKDYKLSQGIKVYIQKNSLTPGSLASVIIE
jgi:hypothetical protein